MTHLPADYYIKPLLAALGIGKAPDRNGWVMSNGAARVGAEIVSLAVWDHDGIDTGSRAICGVRAPTRERYEVAEGPLTEFPAFDSHGGMIVRTPGEETHGYFTREAWFEGDLGTPMRLVLRFSDDGRTLEEHMRAIDCPGCRVALDAIQSARDLKIEIHTRPSYITHDPFPIDDPRDIYTEREPGTSGGEQAPRTVDYSEGDPW